MKESRVTPRALMLAALLVATGCGGGGYVPVSGRVTYNDAPLAGAQVLFQPIGGQGGVATGVGSFGRTDAEGRFTLEASTATPTPGAVPGKHTVRIALPPDSPLAGLIRPGLSVEAVVDTRSRPDALATPPAGALASSGAP